MGGKGSGGSRAGAGRSSKLSERHRAFVINRIEILLREARETAEDEAYRKARPETSAQLDQLFAGEEGLSVEEKAARRQRWLKMPVGRGHAERFEEALRDDQGIEDDKEPTRWLRVSLVFSVRNATAQAKRQVQTELAEKFHVQVHLRTITRIWSDWQAET